MSSAHIHGSCFLPSLHAGDNFTLPPSSLNYDRQINSVWYGSVVLTSLKFSKAAKIISWPPRTKQTAASSSSTRAFVLSKEGKKSNAHQHQPETAITPMTELLKKSNELLLGCSYIVEAYQIRRGLLDRESVSLNQGPWERKKFLQDPATEHQVHPIFNQFPLGSPQTREEKQIFLPPLLPSIQTCCCWMQKLHLTGYCRFSLPSSW